MNSLSHLIKVYVIESPSFIDLLERREEGIALSNILNLSEIKNELYKVSDIQTLNLALRNISEDVNKIKLGLAGVYLHFSLHGSEDGLQLSDLTFLNWQDFYLIIKGFNDSIGYIKNRAGKKIAPTYLNFSTCSGYYASKIKDYGEESPYTGLIGPVEPVNWADSLIAYSVLYHNSILKQIGITKAIENMNRVINKENVFQANPGKWIYIK